MHARPQKARGAATSQHTECQLSNYPRRSSTLRTALVGQNPGALAKLHHLGLVVLLKQTAIFSFGEILGGRVGSVECGGGGGVCVWGEDTSLSSTREVQLLGADER